MDDFLKDFFPKVYERKQAHLHETDYCKYDNQVLTLFTSSLYFAGLLSTFGASLVTRKYGRRMSIMTGAVSFFLGGGVNAAAINIYMLILGRILLGVGIGFGNQVRNSLFVICQSVTFPSTCHLGLSQRFICKFFSLYNLQPWLLYNMFHTKIELHQIVQMCICRRLVSFQIQI